jgi:hypothetical protein
VVREPEPARHERPAIDEAALIAARAADKVLDSALDRGSQRWVNLFATVPDQLRDAGLKELRTVSMRARAAYGAKDSIREYLPADVTEPFLVELDRLMKLLARDAAERR